MTPAQRKSLAQSLLGNALTEELLSRIETDAIERLIAADTEQARIEAQFCVNAARQFRRSIKNFADAPAGINPKGVA